MAIKPQLSTIGIHMGARRWEGRINDKYLTQVLQFDIYIKPQPNITIFIWLNLWEVNLKLGNIL